MNRIYTTIVCIYLLAWNVAGKDIVLKRPRIAGETVSCPGRHSLHGVTEANPDGTHTMQCYAPGKNGGNPVRIGSVTFRAASDTSFFWDGGNGNEKPVAVFNDGVYRDRRVYEKPIRIELIHGKIEVIDASPLIHPR